MSVSLSSFSPSPTAAPSFLLLLHFRCFISGGHKGVPKLSSLTWSMGFHPGSPVCPKGYVISLSPDHLLREELENCLEENKINVVNIAREKPAFCRLVTLPIMVIYRRTQCSFQPLVLVSSHVYVLVKF